MKRVLHGSRRTARAWLMRIALLVWILRPMAGAAEVTGPQVPEYQLKAAFIYNFAKFITWPSNAFERADGPLVVGVVGDDPFGPALPRVLAGKSVNGHPIQIVHFDSTEMPTNCHLLFVPRSEKERLKQVLGSVASHPVLTVGDSDNFAHDGGMINLMVEGKAIRFQINANATERGGFKVSPKLGGLGTIIRGEVVQPEVAR